MRPFPLLLVSILCGFAPAVMASSPQVELRLAAPDDVPPGDDLRQLKRLAAGVGWEFSPDAATTAELKRVGIRSIRCINVDIIPGSFSADGAFVMDGPPPRLTSHLNTCRELGARPHIIIAERAPAPLRISVEQVEEQMAVLGQQPNRRRSYWNGDWEKMRAFWKAIFHHVLIEQNFPEARFEVGNEPDINGQFPRLVGKEGPMGSAALYALYLDVYRNAAHAAEEFEREHPGRRVTLGGPALAWAYTFRFGDFNWLDRFLADTAAERLRLDFIGVHFYGNITSLHGEYGAAYPSFSEMLASAKTARDRHHPGVPIILSEWGPSYHVNLKEESMVNASHVGAAWSAAFLKTILEQGVDEALFLVTTDLSSANPSTKKNENIWGWGSFFVNPRIFGHPWPKAPFHVFDMVSRLSGRRIPLSGARDGIDGIASLDAETKQATLLLWNYAARLPEKAPPAELGQDTLVRLPLDSLRRHLPASGDLVVKTWMVSENLSNARTLFLKEGRLDQRSHLQLLEEKTLDAGAPAYELLLPACSVAFVSITGR